MWYWHLYLKEEALTVFQKSLLSVILFKSRLLKYFFFFCLGYYRNLFAIWRALSVHSIWFWSIYLCCSSVLFIIAFLIVFVTYGAWLALIVLFLIGSCLPKTSWFFFSETWCDEIFVILKEFFRSVLKCFLIKQFKISIGNNFWLTFCKSSF